MALRPFIRSRLNAYVRDSLRRGLTNAQIYTSLPDYLQEVSRSTVYRTIRSEREKIESAEYLMGLDKRRRYNLGEIFNCTRERDTLRAYVTIRWYDRDNDRTYERGYTVELPKEGRLYDILNTALSNIIHFFRGKHYDIPEIRSSMVSGRNSYRVEYVECI